MAADVVDLSRMRRALVVKLRHHGDVLLASPVFSTLKAHAPHLEIDALVYDDTAEMLTHHPAITQVHCVGRKWRQFASVAARAAAEWDLFRALRARNYDLLIQLTDHPRGAVLVRLFGIPVSVAPRSPGRSRWWRRSFTHQFTLLPRRHIVECNLDALRRIGIQPAHDARALTLVPGAAAEARADQLLAEHALERKRFVVFHPASRWLFKCWPADQCARLVDELGARGWPIVLTAAPSVSERELIDAIIARSHTPVVNLAGGLSLKVLAALIARARLFIGVDSAPMHIAAAVQTPLVALFGPSSEIEWGPWGGMHRVVVSADHRCRPCGQDGCGGGKVSECLTTIPVARVLDAVDALIASHPL